MQQLSKYGLYKQVKYLAGLIICLFLIFSFSLNNDLLEFSLIDEICENGKDDDMDGLIDLNDPDCVCVVIEPISLIPNPSFEDMECCPSNRSQLDCASVWIQASEPTTDYIHTCGWFGWDDFPPPTPFPDGQGIMGFRDGRVRQNNGSDRNWKEYAGACLLSPLLKDSLYRFEFEVGFVSPLRSPPVNITFFGTPDCKYLPFGVGNEDFGCPTNGSNWVRLGSTLVSGGDGNKWVKAAIDVTPQDNITAIAIGPDCPAVEASVSIYYFFDNLLLADFKSFELQISQESHPCSDNFTLKVPNNSHFTYQWYKDGVALIGETDSKLIAVYGDGFYQVRIDDGQSCRLSGEFRHLIPVINASANQVICKDDVFQFGTRVLDESGMYTHTFKSANNCDSVVILNLKELGVLADTINAQIFEGEQYKIDSYRFKQEGDHLVNLTSNIGCDSLVLLSLEYYQVFFPNVFSPNGDGFNDLFEVYSEEGLILSAELSIFDRWGTKLFEGTGWNGKLNDSYVSSGIYIYVATLKMKDEIERQFTGSITVIR